MMPPPALMIRLAFDLPQSGHFFDGLAVMD